MPALNTIDGASIRRQLTGIDQKLQSVEAFFAGSPINTARIKNAAIGSAQIVDLSVTNAKFDTLSITNAKITNVDAAQFTVGTLSADRIAAGSITASKLDVSDLSAIATNMGTMTAGSLTGLTITGATVRSFASGTRVEMTASPNALIIYNGTSERVRFDPEGLKITDMGMNFIQGATFKAALFTSTFPSRLELEAGNCDELFIINGKAGGDIQLVAADGTIFMTSDAFIKINGTTKTAILETSRGYNALYCLESPEVWFFDFAKDENSLDHDFIEATQGESNILKTDQGELLVFRKRKGYQSTRFEKKTLEQFDKNNRFWGDNAIK